MITPDDLYDITEGTHKLSERLYKLKLLKYPPNVALSAVANILVVLAQNTDISRETFIEMCVLTWDGHIQHKESLEDLP